MRPRSGRPDAGWSGTGPTAPVTPWRSGTAGERRFGLRIPVVFVCGRRAAEGRVEDLGPVRRAIEAGSG